MKIPPIKNTAPVKFIRSLYYANRPMPKYRAISTWNPPSQKPKLKFVNWLTKLFK